MSTSFGDLVRRGRQQAGISQTRLAELVGKSSSTIRAWEQGRTHPGDPQSVSAVAAVLGLDEADMLGRAGFARPVPSTRHSGLRELSDLASERTEMLALAPGVPSRRPPAEESPTPTGAETVDTSALAPEPSVRRTATAVAAPIPAPTRTVAPLSYLEDATERDFYRRRAVVTAVVLVALVIVAWWALGRAGAAIGDFFDDLIGQLNF